MMSKRFTYSSFTIIEMLIVMAIIIIIGSLGINMYVTFREQTSVNETATSIAQDIRDAQRSAMFLARNPGEFWPYGIGVQVNSDAKKGQYYIFKWCSDQREYGTGLTTNVLLNFDSQKVLPSETGKLDNTDLSSAPTASTSCDGNQKLVLMSGGFKSVTPDVTISAVSTATTSSPLTMVFESVSGRTFFYDATNQLLNYSNSSNTITSNVTQPKIQIQVKGVRTGYTKIITVENLSGVVSVQ